MLNVQNALELRKALQLFVATLNVDTDVDKMLSIPSVFPSYKVGNAYKVKEVFSYGENEVGDPQLYTVLQDHVSTEEWTPDTAVSLYKAIGITKDGVAIWVQPLGASDAYNKGDKVEHKGQIYTSTVDGNVWEPGVYGWELV